MKLDNIIYDVESLATAITNQWNIESPTFKALYPSDTATSLSNTFAAYGAMLQYMLVSAMANCYTTTAYSEAGIYQLANTLGNNLHGNVSAQVNVNVTKNNFIGMNIVIPAETQFEISGKKFFNPSAIICPANIQTVTDVVLVQGEILTVTKTSSGVENEKFYFSSDFKCNHNYTSVTINGEDWIVAESFLPYDKNSVYDASEMNVCVLHTDPDGRTYIKVGNNQLGNMPAAGSTVTIKYVSNDGENGNISESESTGSLFTVLTFINSLGNQENLDVTITSTTTSYGGFSKQSIEVLRQTSPYVFASGNRAIRRQDYEALLINKCGYLTATVWGEYEEANKAGAYDSLMMNMVYYTGIKSFQTYPYFIIGTISDKSIFGGILNSVRGFWGSFSFKIKNLTNQNKYVLVQDTGAAGQLFINNNQQDPRDSLLPDWTNTTSETFTAYLTDNPINAGGSGYKVGEELLISDTGGELKIKVNEVNETGSVTKIQLLKYTASKDWTSSHGSTFNTAYTGTPGSGSGLTVNLTIKSGLSSTLIYTNDDRGMVPPPTQLNPIINARSDQPALKYYQSLWTPTLLQPVQIIISYEEAKAITGIKFKAVNPELGKFIGTMSMFGTNIDPIPSLDNIRNSENWDRLIDRIYLDNPYGNENDNWTDWYPTNCFKLTYDVSGKPEYNRYKHYVIEFYSCNTSLELGDDLITIGKLKMLYEEDSSILYYDSNGKLEINFPTAGDPGPNEKGDNTGIDYDLLNTDEYPMYGYEVDIKGVTSANGYKNGNTLAYIFKKDDIEIPFLIKIINIDNSVFEIYVNGSQTLAGTEYISLNTPASLDETTVYTHKLELENGRIPLGSGGSGYKPNDIVTVNGTDDKLKLKVATVDNSGAVLGLVWINDVTFDKGYNGELQTTLYNSPSGSSGTGLKVKLTAISGSGDGTTAGHNGTIQITSSNNLQVEASFSGNRIDTQSINNLDQPIINQYNHFTTFLEFKQPIITQIQIRAEVELVENANISSGIIIQNIKNNINKLFNITPNYIGSGIKLSDIYKAITDTQYVKWCKVLTPLDNITVEKNGLLILSSLEIIEIIQKFK